MNPPFLLGMRLKKCPGSEMVTPANPYFRVLPLLVMVTTLGTFSMHSRDLAFDHARGMLIGRIQGAAATYRSNPVKKV